VRPILPVDLRTVDQPQVRFVHQSGGLQRVTGPLPRHVALRHSMQLLETRYHKHPNQPRANDDEECSASVELGQNQDRLFL
jgi:hypothetical protein